MTLVKELIIKILNLKLVIWLEYQNIKTFLQKVTIQVCLNKLFVIKKAKNTVSWTIIINDLQGGELLERFVEKNFKKQIKNNLKLKK